MKKIYFIKSNKYRKFKSPQISYILDKILNLSIICDKCGSKHEKLFKEKESDEVLKVLGLINMKV